MKQPHSRRKALLLLTLLLGGCAALPQSDVIVEAHAAPANYLAYELRPRSAASLVESTTPTTLRLQIVPTSNDRVRAIVTMTPDGRRRTARELVLPAAEFNLIVADLQKTGIMGTGSRPSGLARIELGRGDFRIAKDWTPEPRLDDLVERVLRSGRPIPLDERPVIGKASVPTG